MYGIYLFIAFSLFSNGRHFNCRENLGKTAIVFQLFRLCFIFRYIAYLFSIFHVQNTTNMNHTFLYSNAYKSLTKVSVYCIHRLLNIPQVCFTKDKKTKSIVNYTNVCLHRAHICLLPLIICFSSFHMNMEIVMHD